VPCRCDDETGLLKRCRFVKEGGGLIGKTERNSGYVHAVSYLPNPILSASTL
jgi:hypothetical protein